MHLASTLAALQDTLASWQHPLLGGKLEVTQAVPGGRWFLVPTPAFKVRPASTKQLMEAAYEFQLHGLCRGIPDLQPPACVCREHMHSLGPHASSSCSSLQPPAPEG